jgi:hypothetical protein
MIACMPTLLRIGPHTFFIVLHDREERGHVHVRGGGRGEAQYWLDPIVEQATTRGYTGRELSRIERQMRDSREALIRRWDEACKGEST